MAARLHSPVFRWLIIFNYYLASMMLLIAGTMKAVNPAVGDLLLGFYERNLLNFSTVLVIARWQPWSEIILGAVALSGWQMVWSARLMAALYLAFFLLIAVASQGYLLLPVDCGCFGNGGGTPVYLLLGRNAAIAILLFGINNSHTSATLRQRLRPTPP